MTIKGAMVTESAADIINGCRTTRIYCRPDCSAGRRTKPENRVFFSSREEARANGYRPCKVCKPDAPELLPEELFRGEYNSPLGKYTVVSSQRGVVGVDTEEEAEASIARWERRGFRMRGGNEHVDVAVSQLGAYFDGKLRRFTVSLDLRGTPFQLAVWRRLCDVPYGETRSYRQLAQAVGRVNSARPVGQAVGRNPVAIIVPCHRIIGSNGSLTGYAGGLERKQALLNLEAGS